MPKSFTPGPWKANEDTARVYFVQSEGHEPPICATQGIDLCEVSFEQALANARLIAAAPELLDNLQYIDSLIDLDDLSDDDIIEISITGKAAKDIRAAIAKATA